jgi:hypothetical protein
VVMGWLRGSFVYRRGRPVFLSIVLFFLVAFLLQFSPVFSPFPAVLHMSSIVGRSRYGLVGAVFSQAESLRARCSVVPVSG